MTVGLKKITISKELNEFIIPLSEEEFLQLEQNLINDGCRDPLVVWQKDNSDQVLVDGHNRYKICLKHSIPFKVTSVFFPGPDEVRVWMIDNQMGRRNLTPDQLSYYRGLKYLAYKNDKGGYRNVIAKGQISRTTSEVLAEKFSTSEKTIKRDAKFAEGLNIVGRSNPKLKAKILSGEIKVKKADVQTLTNSKNIDRIIIKNEADLFNKAKIIRQETLDEIERKVMRLESEKTAQAQSIINNLPPVFLTKDDRLRRIKGMIISAINRAINKKDIQAIKELKKLITNLADELFE